MKKACKTTHRFQTVIFGLICAMGAGISAYFLYLDVTRAGGVGRGKPMGEIVDFRDRVRRKPASSFLWTSIQEGESLYKRDSIQVGEGGFATVRLKDDTLLEIAENSLVVLDNLNLLEMKFVRGSFIVRKKTGDQKITVKKNGRKKVEPLVIRLEHPDLYSQRTISPRQEKTSVEFRWVVSGKKGASPEFQISKNKNFSDALKKPVTEKGKGKVRVALKPGSYYRSEVPANSRFRA